MCVCLIDEGITGMVCVCVCVCLVEEGITGMMCVCLVDKGII